MKTAEGKLQAQSADGALPPENKALQFLQQAEEEFELQVQMHRKPAAAVAAAARDRSRGPGRLVQGRNGQDGQPVRDQPAARSQQSAISRLTSSPRS